VTSETTEPAGGEDGRIVYTATVTGPDESTHTDSREVTLYAIRITAQPEDTVRKLNATASFTVEATGEGLTYMWQSNLHGEWRNTSFSSSKTDTLKLKVTEARNGIQYRCVITDAYGNTVASEPATLKVAIIIEEQPAELVVSDLNTTAAFHVEAKGEGLTYRWQSNLYGYWKNTSFSSSKTDTLKLKMTEARDGVQYRCVITDAYGNTMISEATTLYANLPGVPRIVKQAADYTGAAGKTATFRVIAAGQDMTYMWQSNMYGYWKDTSFSSSRTDTLKVKVTDARDGVQYRCVVTNADGSVISDPVTITITG
jgi:hypothetical protein